MKKTTLKIDENSTIAIAKLWRASSGETALITSDEILALLPEHLHTEAMVMTVMEACKIAADRMEVRHPLNGMPEAPFEGDALKKVLLTEITSMNLDVRTLGTLRIHDAVHKYAYELLAYERKYSGLGQTGLGKIADFFKTRPVGQPVVEMLKKKLNSLLNMPIEQIPNLSKNKDYKEFRTLATACNENLSKKVLCYLLEEEYSENFPSGEKFGSALRLSRALQPVVMNYLQEEMIKFINETL